ncbi:hypothetical protein VNO77_21159 [Canavalia gladiata]|uniref:Uncharacterized protein n=1 Tax=Canavalia gladiata TaxID=3824 RepID=A0AAN9LQY1_CANGL
MPLWRSISPSYMECLLRIDTSDGWECSVTKVLASFEGKADPHIILTKLTRGGKHATIEWVRHGFPRTDQYQIQGPERVYNRHLIGHQVPFSNATYPYEIYHQLNPPSYYPWHNMAQNAPPFNEYEPCGYYEGRSSSFCSHHHHHYPVHSLHHQSSSTSRSDHALGQSSLSSIQPGINVPANIQPTFKPSSRFEKFCFPFSWLCSKN